MPSVKRDPYKLVGTKLDRYVIQEVAGGGGMGVVYRAQHEITKGIVAIKVLRPDTLLSNEAGVSMFFEEAAKTVALNHPLIVKVTGADYTADGLAFMVMEWLDGHTLGDEMYKVGALPLERVANLLDQICEAVAYAHSKNIIHRDLKPGNIMLIKDERGEDSIRVLDFGIAKALENTVGTNTRMAGSYYYISPEQTVAQGRIDRGTDIYSLGVMLYQMLTGKVPFEADTDGQIIDMHRSIDPVPLRQVNQSIPTGAEEVVLKALAKLSSDRYQSAIDLARAFRQAAQLASGKIILECLDAEDEAPVNNAIIYLNGKHAGQTNETGRWQHGGLTPRKYLIEVEASRYERWNVSESIAASEEVTIPVMLKRQPKGGLVVSCGVAGVEVEVGGSKIGKTDQTGRLYLETVEAGTHTVKLLHPKYLPLETIVEIGVWQQVLSDLALIERPRRQLGKQIWQKVKGFSGNLAPKSRMAEPLADLERKKVDGQSSPPDFPNAIAPTEALADVHRDFVGPQAGLPATLYTCGKCGMQIPAGLKFCIECGAPLSQAIVNNEVRTTAVTSLGEAVKPSEVFPKPVTPQFDEAFKEVDKQSSLEQDQLPYATLSSIPVSAPKRKSVLIALVAAAGLLLALLIGIIAFNRNKISQPVFFDVTLKISPPESQVVIEGRPIQTTDPEGKVMLSGLLPGQNVIIKKPCYDDRNWNAQSPSQNSPVEISLNKLKRDGMACVPGGKLTLGHPSQECPKTGDVEVKPFWIDVTEVTREQYARFLAQKPDHKPLGWGDGSFSGDELLLPVTGIRWDDANAFAQHDGKRLPTEAEWEFAARGGNNDRLYPWGNTFDPNFAHAGQGPQSGPIPVGKRRPNDFGIFDLIGNVWEWTEDSFEGNPCQNSASCPNCKILRGGSFRDSAEIATTYYRLPHPIESKNLSGVGFRCVSRLDR